MRYAHIYKNNGTPVAVCHSQDETYANNVAFYEDQGLRAIEVDVANAALSYLDLAPISSILSDQPTQWLSGTFTEGSSTVNQLLLFQLPANATVIYDATDVTNSVAYSNANVVVGATDLGPRGNYIEFRPGAEDGVYEIMVEHPDYNDFVATATCNGTSISVSA